MINVMAQKIIANGGITNTYLIHGVSRKKFLNTALAKKANIVFNTGKNKIAINAIIRVMFSFSKIPTIYASSALHILRMGYDRMKPYSYILM